MTPLSRVVLITGVYWSYRVEIPGLLGTYRIRLLVVAYGPHQCCHRIPDVLYFSLHKLLDAIVHRLQLFNIAVVGRAGEVLLISLKLLYHVAVVDHRLFEVAGLNVLENDFEFLVALLEFLDVSRFSTFRVA